MAPISGKRTRGEEDVRRPKKKIRIRKQKAYHSSSEDDDEDEGATIDKQVGAKSAPKSILKQSTSVRRTENVGNAEEGAEVEGLDDLEEAERNAALNTINRAEDEEEEDSDGSAGRMDSEADDIDDSEGDDLDHEDELEALSETTSLTSSQAATAKRKRNDPAAFASSISKILDTKLTTSKRSDPVLSRSKAAAEANKDLLDAKLDNAARAQIRAERKKALDKGRITDLLGLQDEGVNTGKMLEEEKRLKKVAQRGVVKLFNAVRAAQVGAETAAKESADSIVGRQAREEKVSEMSKEGFLQMISRGRNPAAA